MTSSPSPTGRPSSTASPPATARRPTARPTRSPTSTLLAPVPRPRAIFGVGLNYAAHAAETGRDAARAAHHLHEAAEQRCAAGRRDRGPGRGRSGSTTRASSRSCMGTGGTVAGFAVADDLSARDLQRREPQWTRAKGFDNSCPYGPWITTADEVADPEDARAAHLGQRRAAPGLDDGGPDLRRRRGRRVPGRDVHARARRPDPHRHPVGRRHGVRSAALPRLGRHRPDRDRRARGDRAPHRLSTGPGWRRRPRAGVTD